MDIFILNFKIFVGENNDNFMLDLGILRVEILMVLNGFCISLVVSMKIQFNYDNVLIKQGRSFLY